jgi:DNA repair exonuclease SbcCD ATPase subunit
VSEESLAVERVDVRRAPGFDRDGFRVEGLSPGVTVVHGPNGAGKTTLARALQLLIWPDEGGPRTEVGGQFTLGDERWTADIDRRRADYQRDGQEANRPALPPAEHRSRYRLSLHELLQHETRNEPFAKRIERESVGGFDVEAAADALGVSDSPSRRSKSEVRAAADTVETLREARQDQEELRSEARTLDGLRKESEAAKEDAKRVDLLEDAIEYAEARDDIRRARADLETFPSVLEAVDGDEIETVERLDERISNCNERLEAAESAEQEAREELEELDLPDEGIPEELLVELRERRDGLAEQERDREEVVSKLAEARERRERARTAMPVEFDDDLETLDPDSWGDLAAFVDEAATVRAERQAEAALEKWLGDPEEPATDVEDVRNGRQELEAWLAHPPTTVEADSRLRRIATISSGLLAVAGVALGLTVHPALFVVALLGAGLLVAAFRSGGGTDGDERARNESAFERLELEEPDSWEPEEVRERLRRLYDAEAGHRLAARQRERYDALRSDDDLEARESALEERRRELRESLGAAPEDADIELLAAAEALIRWQKRDEEIAGLAARRDDLDEQIQAACETISSRAGSFVEAPVDDAASATAAIKSLDEKRDRHETAREDLEAATEKQDKIRENLDELRKERDAVFESLGLDTDETERLRSPCERVEPFEEAVSAIQSARDEARAQARRLTEHSGYEPSLKMVTLDELRDRRDRLDEERADPTELRKQITRIEERVTAARNETTVEDALREREDRLDDLEGLYERDAEAMVGYTLVDHVEEATRDASRPEVFGRARSLLTEITGGRYSLTLDESSGEFRAIDEVRERGRALDELSSGTRLQLLLAVRLAFVEQQEQGVRLPVVFDETLANADDERARAVIETAVELARDGRQVVYLTAQADEVRKWRAALSDETAVDHTVLDLAEARELDRGESPDLEAYDIETSTIPAPDGRDHTEYGTLLEVDPFDPRATASEAHLWYVVDDPDLLCDLLDLGVERGDSSGRYWTRGDSPCSRTVRASTAHSRSVAGSRSSSGRGDRGAGNGSTARLSRSVTRSQITTSTT